MNNRHSMQIVVEFCIGARNSEITQFRAIATNYWTSVRYRDVSWEVSHEQQPITNRISVLVFPVYPYFQRAALSP